MVNPTNRDPYSILDVEKNSTLETVKKKFKKLAIIYHPDKLQYHLNKGKNNNENNQTNKEVKQEIRTDIDFLTLVWAYEQILTDIQSKKKSEIYENASIIKKSDLEYVQDEDTYLFFCRCGDFFIFNQNLYDEYYVIYQCQSCSSSVYLTP
ncbi:DnaJ protein, putative [Plasmodium vinckei lentum]|uniref:DnaJ protein, putative n=1 Tax=Plasmodium vinckei lentum TaxID=138297 RepID=A0A6V7SAF9_PLAVN|nr:DnaJ protein, putative [Plasmodium vinckei lentum]